MLSLLLISYKSFFQQYITVDYCHVNATMGSIYIVVEQHCIL